MRHPCFVLCALALTAGVPAATCAAPAPSGVSPTDIRFAALDGSAVFHDWDTQRPSPVKTSFRKSQTILRSILGGANIRLYFPYSTALSSGFIRTAIG